MTSIFQKLGKKQTLSATYQIGLLQTKAYKTIMGTTADLLAKLKLSNTEWVALGIISEHTAGVRASNLSNIMGVEQPFITVIVNNMNKMGYLEVSTDPTDKRAKIIFLSKSGKAFVKQTEARLSKELAKMSAGISVEEAMGYVKVLNTIVDYSERNS